MADTVEKSSKLWRLALVFALLALAVASYVKIEPFRKIVDEKIPALKERLSQHGISLGKAAPTPAAEERPVAKTTPPPTKTTHEEPAPQQATEPAVPETAAPVTATPASDGQSRPGPMEQLVANHALWPKTVRLKQQTVFPAVVDGRQVGDIALPAGTEVKLVQVQNEKIGVAYSPDGRLSSLGGTYLKPGQTDLLEQVRKLLK